MTTLLPPDISLKALLKLAGPIFVANVAIIGSGTIDTIMGGQLGKEHLAAIALGISATISVLMGLVVAFCRGFHPSPAITSALGDRGKSASMWPKPSGSSFFSP